MPSPCEAVRATSATTAGIQRGVPESNQRAIRGWLRQDDAAASGTRDRKWAHVWPPEHDEEKGKERGKHWLWEGAQSSRARPERAIHSDRFNGQCTLTPHRVVADGWPRDGRRQPNEPSTLPSRDGSSTRRFERICPRLRLPPRRGFFRGPARSRRKFTRLEFGTTSSRDGRDCQVEFKKEQSGTKSVRLKPKLVVKVVL